MRPQLVLIPVLALSLLTGCGQPAGVAPLAAAKPLEAQAQAALTLSGKIKRRFTGFFNRLDLNKDKRWTAVDFDLPDDRFLNCFRAIDTDNDHAVTFEEYWPKQRHDELVSMCDSRAKVYAGALGGEATFEDAFEYFDAYLKAYLNQRDRRRECKEAFDDADANHDKLLSQPELAHALGIMESKAFEKYIERQVNRSKGQPDPTDPVDEQ